MSHPHRHRQSPADDPLGAPAWLTPSPAFVGVAWYARTVQIPGHWQGQRLVLWLEGVAGQTRLWVDGEPAGGRSGLGNSQQFELTDQLSPGKHRLVLQLDNRLPLAMGGAYGRANQSCNGVNGRIELRTTPKVRLDQVRVSPEPAARRVRFSVGIINGLAGDFSGGLRVQVSSCNSSPAQDLPPRFYDVNLAGEENLVEVAYPLDAHTQSWELTNPILYRAVISLNGVVVDRGFDDECVVTFGLCQLTLGPQQMRLNGRPVRLFGDPRRLPSACEAPRDLGGWRVFWRLYRLCGLNYAPFQSECPPTAAFVAADESGVLIGIVPPQGWSLAKPNETGHWQREYHAVVREFGNHPSFIPATPAPGLVIDPSRLRE